MFQFCSDHAPFLHWAKCWTTICFNSSLEALDKHAELGSMSKIHIFYCNGSVHVTLKQGSDIYGGPAL